VTGGETTSELLPAGWNDSETYAIRYLREKELFILRGIRTDDTLILNLLVSGMVFGWYVLQDPKFQ